MGSVRNLNNLADWRPLQQLGGLRWLAGTSQDKSYFASVV
jgi:hypothetical protein